jgi:hypothetical protein
MISDPQKMVKYQRQNALTHSHEPKSKNTNYYYHHRNHYATKKRFTIEKKT